MDRIQAVCGISLRQTKGIDCCLREILFVYRKGRGVFWLMADSSLYKRYSPSIVPPNAPTSFERLFVFNSGKILIKVDSDSPQIPTSGDFSGAIKDALYRQYLGEVEGSPGYCLEVEDSHNPPDGMRFVDLRSLLGQLDEDLFLLAGRAFQIVHWNRMHKYCGKCGTPTEGQQNELVKKCPGCGSMFYPRISPAVIVAVVRDDEILLAHNKNFRPNWYSVIAGFMEPGETFEDCISRELMEEVGIRVKNIKYFDSQPWPFPDSLMVGFIAEHESGEIVVDGEEIEDAAWYGRDNLPPRPTANSIAGRLIDTVIRRWEKKVQSDHKPPNI